ncbi:MAG: homoserine dehydrogenase [Acidimicrobiaceae bacterium]|nr:homoserine dehydrogenase [Acidimicrobiaceae bacterium]
MGNAPIQIGILGCGVVGDALVTLIDEQRDVIEARTGINLNIKAIAVSNLEKQRGEAVDRTMLTDKPELVVSSPEIDIVVELIGGTQPIKGLVETAIQNGKPVVTANKELLSKEGPDLFSLADGKGVDLLFEAAVAGGVPLMRVLRESLIGEPLDRVTGIVNGTTNFILSQMTETGATYENALSEAQSLGYAESDPTADVSGQDAASKAAIIAMVAFGANVSLNDVYYEGITAISSADIAFAKKSQRTVKLLAVVDRSDEAIEVKVYPAMLPNEHPLSSVRDSFNAVFVEGQAVDSLMLYGRGAGGKPTASAVLGDIISASKNLLSDTSRGIGELRNFALKNLDAQENAYYISVQVIDEPGVLAKVASVFGDNNVSIRSMEQEGMGGEARLVFITHAANESDLRETLTQLSGLKWVEKIGTTIRVIEP